MAVKKKFGMFKYAFYVRGVFHTARARTKEALINKIVRRFGVKPTNISRR